MTLNIKHYSIVFGKPIGQQMIDVSVQPSGIVQSRDFYNEIFSPWAATLKNKPLQSSISFLSSTYTHPQGVFVQGEINKIVVGLNKPITNSTRKLMIEAATRIMGYVISKNTDLNEFGINFQAQKDVESPQNMIKSYFKNKPPFNSSDYATASILLMLDRDNGFRAGIKVEADIDNNLIDITANYSKATMPSLDEGNKPDIETSLDNTLKDFERLCNQLLAQ